MIEKVKGILANNWAIDEESRNDVARQICQLIERARQDEREKLVKWLEEYDYGNAPTAMQVINWVKQELKRGVK